MKITIEIKPNYLVIAGIALVTWIIGGYFAAVNMAWYKTVKMPAIAPSEWLIRDMWHIIFPLTTFAAIWIWNKFERDTHFWVIIGLFAVNAFLNVYWCYLFFVQHSIGASLIDALALESTIIALIYLICRRSKLIAFALLPYAGWVTFAIVLNALIWHMN